MQFSRDLREGVASGEISLSVRLWSRPQARVGGRYPVAGALVEVTAVELVPFGSLTDDDVARTGDPDREALRQRVAHAGPVADDTPVYRLELRPVVT